MIFYKTFQLPLSNKAPAGYGLGEIYAKWTTNANESIVSGLYSFGDGCIGAPFQYGIIRVMSRNSEVKIQIAYSSPDATGHTFSAERASVDGGATWGAWEWINPPMITGVEYRTTERYMGKPVYIKLMDFGALPNNTQAFVAHGVSSVERVVDQGGTAVGAMIGSWPLPYFSYDASRVTLISNTQSIFAYANFDASANTATVWFKYTKTTD